MGLGAYGQPRLENELPGQVGFQGIGRHRAEDDGLDQRRVDPDRSSMPRTAWTAMPRESISAKARPALTKGVRPPATMATRFRLMTLVSCDAAGSDVFRSLAMCGSCRAVLYLKV